MNPPDYPSTLRAASAAARAAQRWYFAMLGLQLGASFMGALLAGLAGAVDSPESAHRLRQAAAVALLISFVVLLYGRIIRADKTWWDARAVAESLKSAAWRYMVRAAPFDAAAGASSPEDAYHAQVIETLRARPAVSSVLERRRAGDSADITPLMSATREGALEERRASYRKQRLADQMRWYHDKAASHDRAREIFFLLAVVLQLAAVLAAFLEWRPGKLNVVPLLVTFAASLTAWAQARRHEESAQAYAVARQELDVMADRLNAAGDERSFSGAVAETEAAISREHTMWMARRNR